MLEVNQESLICIHLNVTSITGPLSLQSRMGGSVQLPQLPSVNHQSTP